MPVLYTQPTIPQIEGLTREGILQRFLRDSGLGEYGTATGGSTTTIEDTSKLLSTQYSADRWIGGWSRISFNTGGAGSAPEGEVASISDYVPSTGILTTTPAMTTGIASGDRYELWRTNPNTILDILDQVLKEDIYLPHWSILSYLPDFDMEQSGISEWTASGATVTKITSEPLLNGKSHLSVVDSGSALEYARTDSMAVEPSETYHVSAIARGSAASMTARLQAFDVTNGAVIDSKDNERQYPGRIWFEFTIPSTCELLQIRLVCVQASSTIFWDDVVLYPLTSYSIPLPWWVKHKDQVKGVFELQPYEVTDDIWDTMLRGEPDTSWDIRDNAFGRGQLTLVRRFSSISRPLFIMGTRNETAYSSDTTDIKLVAEDLLVAGLARRVFEMLANLPTTGTISSGWIRERATYWKQEWVRLLFRHNERLEQILTSQSPDGQYNDPAFIFGGGR